MYAKLKSHMLKFLAPLAKGAQNGGEKVHVFVTGT